MVLLFVLLYLRYHVRNCIHQDLEQAPGTSRMNQQDPQYQSTGMGCISAKNMNKFNTISITYLNCKRD